MVVHENKRLLLFEWNFLLGEATLTSPVAILHSILVMLIVINIIFNGVGIAITLSLIDNVVRLIAVVSSFLLSST